MTIPRPVLALAFLSLVTTSIAIVAIVLNLIGRALALPLPTPASTQPAQMIATPSPRHTSTEVPIVAQAPTETNTPTATPTPTDTPIPTATFTPSATPTETAIPPTETQSPRPTQVAAVRERCTSVVGDSVAHGEAVYEVPYTGYILARFATVAAYIKVQFQARGDTGMKVYSRTVPAVGISSGGYPSYFGTAEFAQLLADRCAYVVIIPWINDLSGDNAAGHAAALGNLVLQVLNSNPSAKVLVVNYYYGTPAPFAMNFASGFTRERVDAFNGAIAAQCGGGALARPNVVCVDAASLFAGGSGHLSGVMSRDEFQNSLIAPMSGEEQGFFNSYFGQNPNGQLSGDGVHLSAAGKQALAAHLMQWLR